MVKIVSISHEISWWRTVNKKPCRLGCGFALSGFSTSLELCGKPLESHCPPCRYITHHGVGVWCHSYNRVPSTKNGRGPNPVQPILKDEREEKDRGSKRKKRRLKAMAGTVSVHVWEHMLVHAGTLLVGRGHEDSCVFGLPCEHPVHWEKNGDRRSAMLISIPPLSNTLSHPYAYAHTHTQRKLPGVLAKSVSITLLSLPSNWHFDWWQRASSASKWLLAGLQRERQESS